MNSETRNIMIAGALCISILVGFELFFPSKKPSNEKAEQSFTTLPVEKQEISTPSSAAKVESAGRCAIKTDALKGSISLRGLRLDDLVLRRYKESLDKDSEPVTLLSSQHTEEPYYVEFGWTSPDKNLILPDSTTIWTASTDTITVDTPGVFTWVSPQGLIFTRTVHVDENYLFSIKDSVQNTTALPINVYGYGLVSRGGNPSSSKYFVLHEGPIGYLEDAVKEYKYEDLKEDNLIVSRNTSGWFGFTDKYWLTAIIPQTGTFTSNMRYVERGDDSRYQTDYITKVYTVAPGQTVHNQSLLFSGAKAVSLLDRYAKAYGITQFDRAIDFGWFYFITKPIFYAINWLYKVFGNFGLAIMALTILMRLAFFPLANKSFRSMAKLRDLQPKIQLLKERYKDDKVQLQKEMMRFYKENNASPVSGCLPMLLQFPVFFGLYKVLFVTLEMRHVPFFGWLKDLSAPDPSNIFNLFGLLPFTPPSFLHLGILPLLMGVSMFFQQKLNPQPVDPSQEKVLLIMPFLFTFMLSSFPSGLVLYWAWSNVIAIFQQWYIARSYKKAKKV